MVLRPRHLAKAPSELRGGDGTNADLILTAQRGQR